METVNTGVEYISPTDFLCILGLREMERTADGDDKEIEHPMLCIEMIIIIVKSYMIYSGVPDDIHFAGTA